MPMNAPSKIQKDLLTCCKQTSKLLEEIKKKSFIPPLRTTKVIRLQQLNDQWVAYIGIDNSGTVRTKYFKNSVALPGALEWVRTLGKPFGGPGNIISVTIDKDAHYIVIKEIFPKKNIP